MSDVSKNTCVNCKYFIQHYVKLKYKFRKIECGHCINNFMKKSEKAKTIKTMGFCAFWEYNDIADKDCDIEKVLIETAENLRKIERFLHSD